MSPKAKCAGKKTGCNALITKPTETPVIIIINGVAHAIVVRQTQPV